MVRLFLKPKNNSHWHDVFQYEPSTGNLINRYTRGRRAKVGAVVGHCRSDGYVQIGFQGNKYLAHRVIMEMINGPIPDGMQIDHINGVRDDNRQCNLRLASHSENMRNQKRRINNTTGYTGVDWFKRDGKYRAQIKTEGLTKYLGLFDTAEEAHQAYLAAARELGFHENHGRDQ